MGAAGSDIELGIDSLYIDDLREYPIAINAQSGGKNYLLNPEIFEWTVVGDDCCEVVEGAVKGLRNGRTLLQGKYDDMEVELPVVVEIGYGEMVHEDFSEASSYPLTSSSAVSNIRFDSSVLPVGWNDGATLQFDLSTGRAPNVVLDKPIQFYGLPDSVSMQIKNWDSIINTISCEFSSLSGSWIHTLSPLADSDSVYTVSLGHLDVAAFPVSLKSMKIYLSTQEKGSDRKISFRDFKAYYPHEASDGVEALKSKNGSALSVSKIAQGIVRIQGNIEEGESLAITISDMNGRILASFAETALYRGSCDVALPLVLSPGVYLIGVQTQDSHAVEKLVW